MRLIGNGVNLVVEDTAKHALRDSIIGGHDGAVILWNKGTEGVALRLRNVRITGEPWPALFREPPRPEPWTALAGRGGLLAAAGVSVEEPLVVPVALRSLFTAPDMIPAAGSP